MSVLRRAKTLDVYAQVMAALIWLGQVYHLLPSVRQGEKGEGSTTHKPLSYKNTPIHRIVKSFMIQGGDFSEGL